MLMGAGRTRVESKVDPAVGVVLRKKVGDPVEVGDVLAVAHVNGASADAEALAMIAAAYEFADAPPELESLIVERH